MYHNIQEQIPSWNRSMVRFTYLVELISIAAFFYNCLIVLIAIFARVGPGLNWWFISLLALVMGVPLSWWLFYKGVFNSAQTDGATYSYIRTFLTYMLHLAWCVWMILAVPHLGTFSAGEARLRGGAGRVGCMHVHGRSYTYSLHLLQWFGMVGPGVHHIMHPLMPDVLCLLGVWWQAAQ